ncbi:MAG TPA: response regulator transcription factor [Syntrophales bacterium]
MKIFIVDDSALVVERVRALLFNIDGLEFIGHATNANDAVDAIERLKPEVVVLDIRLISGNGMTVLERVKRAQPPPVVIMLTNYPYPQYREKCRELGAEYFFDKVTEITSFVKLLRTMAQDPSQGELPLRY